MGKLIDLKRGEVSSSFISYNITISWLHALDGFRFIFLLRDSENDLLAEQNRWVVEIIITTSPLSGSFESPVKESDVDNILKSGNITNTDSETLNQETTSLKRKRPVSK